MPGQHLDPELGELIGGGCRSPGRAGLQRLSARSRSGRPPRFRRLRCADLGELVLVEVREQDVGDALLGDREVRLTDLEDGGSGSSPTHCRPPSAPPPSSPPAQPRQRSRWNGISSPRCCSGAGRSSTRYGHRTARRTDRGLTARSGACASPLRATALGYGPRTTIDQGFGDHGNSGVL